MPNSTGLVTEVKNKYTINFFDKQKLVIERGEGVWVYSDMGDKYLDLTSGWAVTCSGHAHPTITQALIDQSLKIIPIPNSQFPIPV